jgi:hypothetical protein
VPSPRRLSAILPACAALALAGGLHAAGDAGRARDLGAAKLGRGLVVWESNRTGAYRIWTRSLDGSPDRQLSPDENGRDHCCAHLSPDGERVAYLSIPGGARRYGGPELEGELRWIGVRSGRGGVIAPAARHYGEHRAALWWSDDELAYIGPGGSSRLADLSTGTSRLLSAGPAQGEGWLIDPSGRWTTSSTAHFSPRDPATGRVALATPLGGCQAWVAPDGEVGVWSAGAGGPIDAIELATRRTWTILARSDPRLPADRGYLYFPMLSRDRGLLAFAASNGDHDHFTADYDVFLIPLDPVTLRPAGAPVRVSEHPAVDRYPDVWREGMRPAPPLAPPAPVPPTLAAAGWPVARDALVFLWEGADRPNRIAGDAASDRFEEGGEAWSDRRGRLALAGGGAEAPRERAAEVGAALQGANAVTLEMVVEPASAAPGAGGVILALGNGPRQRGLWFAQKGAALELRVRTGPTGPGGGTPARVAAFGAGPRHVALTYSPGRLRVYVDGELAAAPEWTGDFFPWRARRLTVGFEPEVDGAFRGWVSHLAISAREATAAEIAVAAERALAALAAAAAVESAEVEAVLVARSRVPTLEEISPYRRALVVESWRVERVVSGALAPGTIRVARWALLDGRPAAAVALPRGARARLRLEPFDAQPQLASLFLSDDDPAGGPLWAEVGVGGTG